jgi:hypothetical protein
MVFEVTDGTKRILKQAFRRRSRTTTTTFELRSWELAEPSRKEV